METVRNFDGLGKLFRNLPRLCQAVIVCPDDEHTEYVISRCLEEKSARFTLVTTNPESDFISSILSKYPDAVTVVPAQTKDDAAAKGVSIVREGNGDVLVKGNINTDNLLRAVLNKESGLLPKGRVLSHVTAVEAEAYNKLLLFSDAAVIPNPTYEQFDAMISYDTNVAVALGVKKPNVALIHFTEKVNEKFQITLDYVELKKNAAEGKYGDAVVDGPMDAKTAVDSHSAMMKGISSEVPGNADILIFPNLEASNTFYKTVSFFGHAKMAGLILGPDVPVVVPSRADSAESKYYSLALACVVALK